ncbi:MAG: DUF4304 domain-containing protein [Candidatus Kapaibacterium sp.]
MSNHELAQSLLTEFFLSEGFRKNGRHWYKKFNDTFLVFQYQRSMYGAKFYINCGIYYNKIKPIVKGFPKLFDCHVDAQDYVFIGNIREPRSTPEELGIMSTMFRADGDDNTIKKNILSLTEILRQEVIPFMEKYTDIPYLATIYPDQYNWPALPDRQGAIKHLTNEYKESTSSGVMV